MPARGVGKRWRGITWVAVLGFAAGTLAGCGPAVAARPTTHAIRLVDDLGNQVVLRAPARRLVVLEPSNFEIVDALGLRRDIVGVDTSVPQYTPAPWQAQTRGLVSVGPSFPGISVERVVAAKPDLVLATTGIAGLSGLKALHVPVLILNPQSIAGVYHDIDLVGEATAHLTAARTLVRRMQAEVGQLSRLALRTRTRPTVFYDLGGLYTAGPHTFINNLIQLAGGVNVGARLSARQWPQVSAEQVVKADPDIILVDPDATSPAKERLIPGFPETTAGRTGHIEAIPNSAYVNEPSMALIQGLRELINLIHPEVLTTR